MYLTAIYFYYLKGEGIYLCMWYYKHQHDFSLKVCANTAQKKTFVLRIFPLIFFFLRSWDNCPHLLFCCLPEGGGAQRPKRRAMGIRQLHVIIASLHTHAHVI